MATATPVDDGTSRDRLQALGYAHTVRDDPNGDRSGVVRTDASRISPGTNVYCSEARSEIRFIDVDGVVVDAIPLPPRSSKRTECLPVEYDATSPAVARPILSSGATCS